MLGRDHAHQDKGSSLLGISQKTTVLIYSDVSLNGDKWTQTMTAKCRVLFSLNTIVTFSCTINQGSTRLSTTLRLRLSPFMITLTERTPSSAWAIPWGSEGTFEMLYVQRSGICPVKC